MVQLEGGSKTTRAQATVATSCPTPSSSPREASISAEDFQRIEPKLVAQIRRLGFSPPDCEDLVQESFLQAHQALTAGRFRGDSELDTWVVGIAKNLCLKRLRLQRAAKRKAPEVALDAPRADATRNTPQLKSDEPNPEDVAGDRHALALVQRALHALPESLRSPLLLFARGNTYKEIAAILRITPDLVTSRVHQARSKLRGVVSRPPRGSPG